MLGIDELAELPNAPLVHEALPVRVDDGLATRLGDMVGVSRATTRFDAHTPTLKSQCLWRPRREERHARQRAG